MKMASKINRSQNEDVASDISAVRKTKRNKRLMIKLNLPSQISSNYVKMFKGFGHLLSLKYSFSKETPEETTARTVCNTNRMTLT